MKIEVNISKKYFFIILASILIAAGVFVVYAYGSGPPSVIGHTGTEVDVTIAGQPYTLQQAIDQGKFSGGPDYDSGWISSWIWEGSGSRTTQIVHPLGQTPSRFLVYAKIKTTGGGANNIGDVFMLADNEYFHSGLAKFRAYSVFSNSTTMGIYKYQDEATIWNTQGQVNINPTEFSLRYMAWK